MTSNIPVTHRPNGPSKIHWTGFLRNISRRTVRVGELALVNSGPPLTCRAVGSTVAVCFHVPDLSIAGILHVAFPAAHHHRALGQTMPFVFADRGIAEVARVLSDLEVKAEDVQVAMVGGSRLMDDPPTYDGPQRLVRAVEVMLATHGLVIQTRHLGGSRARHVHQAVFGQLLVLMTAGQP
ncbi:MAG: chemotaxis receptor (MCP) glutamine deamidase CheD [Myxococcota bacterium]|jgi:chemotaxis receptor (MCP) glutamine deamidase CheD